MRLPYTDLFATYQVVTPFRIPAHPGSLWRGVIGRILRREGLGRACVRIAVSVLRSICTASCLTHRCRSPRRIAFCGERRKRRRRFCP